MFEEINNLHHQLEGLFGEKFTASALKQVGSCWDFWRSKFRILFGILPDFSSRNAKKMVVAVQAFCEFDVVV